MNKIDLMESLVGKNGLSRIEAKKLINLVFQNMAEALAQGGTTLRDFVGGDGKPGYFRQRLRVYGRGGMPCLQCARPLREWRLAQRTTVYCQHCQR